MNSVVHCPACEMSLTKEGQWLLSCRKCGLQVSTLEPGAGTGVDGLEQLRRSNFEILLDQIETIRPLKELKLLEVGAAKGWFLQAASARGAIVSGVEPETANALIARKHGFNVDVGLFPASPADKGPYDIIVFNDVFEHIPHPEAAILSVEQLLSDNGIVVMNIPSSAGVLYRIAKVLAGFGVTGPFDRMWQKGMPSPHVSYFSPANLKMLVEHLTSMRQTLSSSLPSVSRNGLRDRIKSQGSGGIPWQLSYAVVWGLSFVLPALPPDIHVAIFTKAKSKTN